ncbi:PTS sugar transporter subunit IIB [Streptococcus castoreus]|uniref:PTS sugar transporter subunit IIB n=1 Tax=Streptococcus castoreus TaxID=254786 RepID=UPI0003FAB2AA|nr:PTS sugar transporter subunit IIB [Streptococcus castoreus]
MNKIMLVCSAGMSTSMLVSRMLKAAKEENINVAIFAKPAAEADEILESEKITLVLLGPQVKFLENKYKDNYLKKGIKIAVINMQDYGMMDGKKVLKDAMLMIKGE